MTTESALISNLLITADRRTSIFDGAPSETGTDLSAGYAVVTLDPGNYEAVATTSDPTYFAGEPFAFTVSEGMSTVPLQLEQGGFVTLRWIDTDTGLAHWPTTAGASVLHSGRKRNDGHLRLQGLGRFGRIP